MTQMSISQAMELAMRHHRAGNLAQAETIYRQILAAQPDQTDAMHLLGLVELGRGQFPEALELIDRAISRHGDESSYHYSRGQVLQASGKGPAAIEAYRRATGLRGDFAEAWNNLGTLLMDQGRLSEAIESLRKATVLRPEASECWNNLSTALLKNEQLDDSISAAERAIRLKPDFASAHVSLGLAFQRSDQFGRAIGCFEQALKVSPDSTDAAVNLGMALVSDGRIQEGIDRLRQLLAKVPDQPMAHYGLGKALLLMGDYANGWRESEWRWKVPELQSRRLAVPTPWWDGKASLQGRDILVWPEQGLGDTIQFSRYVPLVARQARRVILMCQPPLVRLLRGLEGVEEVIAVGDPVPRHDVHVPLMSLPLAFGPSNGSDPFPTTPRLDPDPARIEYWRGRLGELDGRIRVGLVWAGNYDNRHGRKRSMKLHSLAPLAAVENVRFISLQKSLAPGQRETSAPPFELVDFTSELTDFTETGALIANLDLVISIDTAVAHLAGTLGKPVWILLSSLPDWRWGLERTDSPWYPTARLFRQPVAGDWGTPIDQVRAALVDFANR